MNTCHFDTFDLVSLQIKILNWNWLSKSSLVNNWTWIPQTTYAAPDVAKCPKLKRLQRYKISSASTFATTTLVYAPGRNPLFAVSVHIHIHHFVAPILGKILCTRVGAVLKSIMDSPRLCMQLIKMQKKQKRGHRRAPWKHLGHPTMGLLHRHYHKGNLDLWCKYSDPLLCPQALNRFPPLE